MTTNTRVYSMQERNNMHKILNYYCSPPSLRLNVPTTFIFYHLHFEFYLKVVFTTFQYDILFKFPTDSGSCVDADESNQSFFENVHLKNPYSMLFLHIPIPYHIIFIALVILLQPTNPPILYIILFSACMLKGTIV